MQTAGMGLIGSVGLFSLSTETTAQSDALVFEQQESDGDSIVIASVSVNTEGTLMIQDQVEQNNTIFDTKELPAGTNEQNLTVELDQPIEETQVIEVWLWDGDVHSSDVITVQQAIVAVNEDIDATLGKTFVEADPEAGFNYPYYLFSPTDRNDGQIPLLVEPNNTGTATDDFEQHKSRAEFNLANGPSRPISEELGIPLLIPVFPRPMREPVDGTHYTHQLDRQTLEIEGNDLERIDRQLLRMIEDAKDRLSGDAYTFREKIILNGFSASGNFADRFTVLHPEHVLSVTAGGLNGMALLPHEEWNGHTLDYHVGIGDLGSLTGKQIDVDQLNEVNQLLYMGSEDTNDTIPYDDAWNDELRELALNVYGEDMIEDRFPECQRAYEAAGIDAQFKIYTGRGHRPAENDELVEFHRRSINGKDISDFGDQLGVIADFRLAPTEPRSGEQIEFDAGGSSPNVGTLVSYTWDFGDGQTAAGETTTHRYEETGTYQVTLTVVSDQGTTVETTQQVVVQDDGTSASDDTATTSPSESTDDSGPGFGIGSSVAGIGGMAYLLGRRVTGSEDE